MKTTVKRVNLPDDRRILMISDIHGHAEGLQAVLEQAGFCPQDVLIIVGDMVEKGPDSLKTLRLVITALESQEASASCVYIRWGGNEVTVLERREDWARVLFHDRDIEVPSALLYEENGSTHCDDITDYRLPVEKGDALSLVLRTQRGCYVKKGSVTGWYTGAYSSPSRNR